MTKISLSNTPNINQQGKWREKKEKHPRIFCLFITTKRIEHEEQNEENEDFMLKRKIVLLLKVWIGWEKRVRKE